MSASSDPGKECLEDPKTPEDIEAMEVTIFIVIILVSSYNKTLTTFFFVLGRVPYSKSFVERFNEEYEMSHRSFHIDDS